MASGWSCGSLLEDVVCRFSVKAATTAAVTNMHSLFCVFKLYSCVFSPLVPQLKRNVSASPESFRPTSGDLFSNSSSYSDPQPLLSGGEQDPLLCIILYLQMFEARDLKKKKKCFNGDSLKQKDRAHSCISKHVKTFIAVTTEPLVSGSKGASLKFCCCLNFPYLFFDEFRRERGENSVDQVNEKGRRQEAKCG